MIVRICDYCCKKKEGKTLARVTWKENKAENYYCPNCLHTVLDDAKSLPWFTGYKIDYPLS